MAESLTRRNVVYRTRPPGGWSTGSGAASWRGAAGAGLSFVLPGLGQLYNGQGRLGLLFLLLVPLLVLPLVVLPIVARGSLVASLVDTEFLVRLIVLDLVLLAIRLAAIAQAHVRRAEVDFGRPATYVTVALVAVTLVMHAAPALYAAKAFETLNEVALGGGDRDEGVRRLFEPAPEPSRLLAIAAAPKPSSTVSVEPTPTPTPSPTAAPATPPPTPTPVPVAAAPINILLVGADQKPHTDGYLTDTLIVLSLHPDSGRSVMLSIPRDTWGIPLADGRIFGKKINSIAGIAQRFPERYPLGPMQTLKGAVSTLLDAPIDHVIAIDLKGFTAAVDAIGGVDITVEQRIADPTYRDPWHPEFGRGFYIDPGSYHMDGVTALAYVRSRRGPNNGEPIRVERQQRLLVAIRQQLEAYDLVASLPSLLDVIGPMVATDVPVEEMPALAVAVERSRVDAVERVVLTAPDYATVGRWNDQYILIPDLERIRALADELLQ